MSESILHFLKNYSGANRFIISLQKFHARHGMLTDKQIKALERFMEKGDETELGAEKEQVSVTDWKEEAPKQSLVEITTLEEETTEAVMQVSDLQTIENKIQAIAGKVVEETMREANRQANLILKSCEQLAKNKPLLHIKIGESPTKKLSKEASPYLPKILINSKLGYNTLLVGPAGTGKTTMAQQTAEALGLPFGMLSCTAGMSESWLYGRQYATGTTEGLFSKMFRNGGVFLLDELDAADANFMTGPNAALENGVLFNPITNEMHERHKDFVCIAAANTYGLGGNAQYTGRNRLDAATLERFVTISVWYNEKLEASLCDDTKLFKKLQKARKKLKDKNAREFISTRQFIRIPSLINGGYTEEEAIKTFTDAWPVGLAEEVGLLGKDKITDAEIPF